MFRVSVITNENETVCVCVSIKRDVHCNLHCQFMQPKIRMLSEAGKASLCDSNSAFLLFITQLEMHTQTHK